MDKPKSKLKPNNVICRLDRLEHEIIRKHDHIEVNIFQNELEGVQYIVRRCQICTYGTIGHQGHRSYAEHFSNNLITAFENFVQHMNRRYPGIIIPDDHYKLIKIANYDGFRSSN